MLGPTAAGKSDVAMEIATRCGGEIVSVDSMQVYRGLDIGTAKPDAEMQQRVRHHLLDLREPTHDMTVAEFQREGRAAMAEVAGRGVAPVICGGSGLHFRSLVDPLDFPPSDPDVRAELEALDSGAARDLLVRLDPAASEHIDLANPRRVVRALEVAAITSVVPSQRARTASASAVRDYTPHLDFVAVGLDPGSDLEDRVIGRFDAMLADGLVAEVAALAGSMGRAASQAVGYKELLPVVAGDADLVDGRAAAIQATRGLAKRQRTFFRRDPRIHWVPWHPDPRVRTDAVIAYLNGQLSWIL